MKEDWEEDFQIDDILKNKEKSKRVNGNKKGKRTERSLANLLNKRFKEGFSRSLGSGNRWSQVSNLPKHAKETLTGDICCPEGFKFVIESKGGYSKIDLNNIFEKGNTELDDFIKQVSGDSKKCDKKPLLIWKKDRRPWLAFIRKEDLQGTYEYKIIYREWIVVPLKELLELPDSFFFYS
jgi:hypothetical protein